MGGLNFAKEVFKYSDKKLILRQKQKTVEK
jgi:hypothetical protein